MPELQEWLLAIPVLITLRRHLSRRSHRLVQALKPGGEEATATPTGS